MICWIGVILTSCAVTAGEIVSSKDKALVSLDFQEIDVRKALHLLAKFTQLNLVVESAVQGKISLTSISSAGRGSVASYFKMKKLNST